MSPLFSSYDDESFLPDFSIETGLAEKGYKYIAGVDEAGRGALAGPLSLGMVIYPVSCFTTDNSSLFGLISDSKKLSEKKREIAYEVIESESLLSMPVFVSHGEIDRSDINRATKSGVEKLLAKSEIVPDIIIMDGNFKFTFDIPFVPVVKGDGRSISIASASIIAKVSRDRLMQKIEIRYPGYDFGTNKGYGTKGHIASINEIGFSPVHRKSYEPVKSMVEGERLLFD